MKMTRPLSILLLSMLWFSSGSLAQPSNTDSLNQVINTTTSDSVKVLTMLQLGESYRYSYIDKSLALANKAYALSKKTGFKRGIAKSAFMLGLLDLGKGNMPEAKKRYEEAKKIFEEINDRELVAKMVYNLGIIEIYRGDYAVANEHFFSALQVYDSVQNDKSISDCYTAIANGFGRMENHRMEQKYHEMALAIKLKLKDDYGIAACYINLGNVYARRKINDTALKYYFDGLKISEKLQNQKWILNALGNIGTVYTEQGKTKEGLEYILRSIAIAEKIGDRQAICQANNLIAHNYLEIKDYEKAKIHSEKALIVAREIGIKSEIRQAYDNLARIAYAIGKHQQAYDYHVLYTEMKDSILNEETSGQINEMQAKYDTEKKEQEISLLNKDKEIQSANLERQKLVSWLVSAGLLIVLVLAFFTFRQYQLKQKANVALVSAYSEIEEKNKNITDSINYARRIQTAILPSLEIIKSHLNAVFIFYKPKDIVSGDFYWFTEKNGFCYMVIADCTGHGVPGAFMSMIGNDLLTQIIIEKGSTQPNMILTDLHEGVKNALKQDGGMSESKDGMDIAIVKYKPGNNELEYAGALRPLWLVKNNSAEITEFKPDKHSIGGADANNQRQFTNHVISVAKGDSIYLSTDGYADQFGGVQGKKMMTKNMKDFVLNIQSQSMTEQRIAFEKNFTEWQGNREQIDDVLVAGLRI